jgi:DNA-binding SARP family transcriptional activator
LGAHGDLIRIYLAGNLAVERSGVLVPETAFPGTQGRLVFAILAIEHARAVLREELAEELWGEQTPKAWDTALRAIVSKLRTALGPVGLGGTEMLANALGCYQLKLPPDVWIDVEVATDAAHRAESALRRGRPNEANGWSVAAASITMRPFLPGADGPWAARRRAQMNDVRIRALECRGEILIRKGDHALAVHDAETVVELEPFRETGYRLLMRAHTEAGNPAEALRVYERCRRVLADELGTSPSPQTEAVYLDLLGVVDTST